MDQPSGQGTASPKPVTTFVQADSTSFRDVVQRLTGPVSVSDPTLEGTTKKPPCKLQERRQRSKPRLQIEKPTTTFANSNDWQNIFSGSMLVSPSFGYPRSPLTPGNRNKREASVLLDDLNPAEEERAIKERRFYLHPSPRSKPRYTEPELLTLFPLASPQNES